MRFFSLLTLTALIACSSAEKKQDAEKAKTPSPDVFKKERPLKSAEVQDFYTGATASLNPALQDETLDRYSAEELAAMPATQQDPLLEIAVRCSRGDAKTAFAIASKAFDRYQKVALYWNLVANCHLGQGAYRKALLFYNKALEVKPDYVPALNNIGVMYSRMGQDQKALVAFERANKQSRFAKTPRYNLGKTYLKYGLADLGQPLLEGLLREAPQDVDLLNAVGTANFIRGNNEAALAAYQQIPQNQWTRPEIGLNIALVLNQVGRKEDARKVFGLVSSPENNELKKYYAGVEKRIGE